MMEATQTAFQSDIPVSTTNSLQHLSLSDPAAPPAPPNRARLQVDCFPLEPGEISNVPPRDILRMLANIDVEPPVCTKYRLYRAVQVVYDALVKLEPMCPDYRFDLIEVNICPDGFGCAAIYRRSASIPGCKLAALPLGWLLNEDRIDLEVIKELCRTFFNPSSRPALFQSDEELEVGSDIFQQDSPEVSQQLEYEMPSVGIEYFANRLFSAFPIPSI